METFKIATYNVNSIRSRLHIVIPWLQENQPTVFCMQETKVEDKKFPVKEFEDAGYHVVFKGENYRCQRSSRQRALHLQKGS